MALAPIFWISGPPAAGKSTLCAALLARFEFGIHIPVDDLRPWVVSGFQDSVPWTDETERQFQIAERAVCGIVRPYHENGFAVAVDHCRNMRRLEQAIQDELSDLAVIKVCLMPELSENLHRSHTRTNKPFAAHHLDETIRFTNAWYREERIPGWHLIDNTRMTVDDTLERILKLAEEER